MALNSGMSHWGLSYDDFVAMFALSDVDLKKKILNCMAAPSSFPAIARQKKYNVLTCSDVYGADHKTLQMRAQKEVERAIEFIKTNPKRYSGQVIETPDKYQEFLEENLHQFLSDYEKAKSLGLYSSEALPEVPFADHEFDLAICPHFVFGAGMNYSFDFQLNSILEMCRVAKEVRVFPLLDSDGEEPEQLSLLLQSLADKGFSTRVETVKYRLEAKGDTMLKVRSF